MNKILFTHTERHTETYKYTERDVHEKDYLFRCFIQLFLSVSVIVPKRMEVV